MAITDIDTPLRKPSSGLSPVWFVPLIALLVAAWLGYRAWQETGPTIQILFSQASGITAGKTEIRYKDVKVGLVSNISLDKELNKVRITAQMDPVVVGHLSANSLFWLVEPKVGLRGVSGLNTLFSGVYLEIDPGEAGTSQSQFIGLEEPPTIKSTDVGRLFRLYAKSLGSLAMGSPVYYRQIPVGRIVGYHLIGDGEAVEINIFINAPYDKLVFANSHFWNVSGFGMELDAQGLKVSMESVVSLIAGGIAFKTESGVGSPEVVEADHQFKLFADEESIAEEAFTIKYHYLMNFSGSVRGLELGAPLEFRGIRVGEVTDIRFTQDSIQVTVVIEPQRLDLGVAPDRVEFDKGVNARIAQGMKAQLKTGNLLTGALYVELIEEQDSPGQLITKGYYPEIPTTVTEQEQLFRNLSEVSEKLNQFPLDEIGSELAQSLKYLRVMMENLEQQRVAAKMGKLVGNLESASADLDTLVKSANQALAQVDTTLNTLDKTIAPDSDLHYQSMRLINQLTKAANAFRQLAEELNRDPSSVVFGKEKRQ